MPRRIKRFPNKHLTYPIKEKRDIQRLLRYFDERAEEAKTPTKRYQADRDYMIIQMGLNTAFRAEDLLQLRACDLGILGQSHAEALADELDKVVDRITTELKKDKGGDANEA